MLRSISQNGKGWFAGPWESDLPVPVGYADVGFDEPHVHEEMYEIYLIARGTSTAVVDGVEHQLSAGQMLAVEPGEWHTFKASSTNYLHFVIQAPFVAGDKTLA